jgi:hypothetical protein
MNRAMNGDPGARYPTARAMRDDLEQYASNSNTVLPDARDLSGLVSSLFAPERQKRQTLIEARLNVLRQSSVGEVSFEALPPIVLTPLPPTVSLARPPAFAPPPERMAPGAAPVTAPPVVALPAPARARTFPSILGMAVNGIAMATVAAVAAGGVVLLTARRPVRPVASEVAPSPPAIVPAETQPSPVPPVAPSPSMLERPHEAIPRLTSTPARAFATRSHLPPPPPRPTALATSVVPAAVVADPAALPPPQPSSAIAAPTAKPLREILKGNPYLQ